MLDKHVNKKMFKRMIISLLFCGSILLISSGFQIVSQYVSVIGVSIFILFIIILGLSYYFKVEDEIDEHLTKNIVIKNKDNKLIEKNYDYKLTFV